MNKYVLLTILGTILPNIFVIRETVATGNFLLYAHPVDTLNGMFANNISSAFAIDLLFVVCLFLAWSYQESSKLQIKNVGWVWMYTFAFGIAGGLPLFLLLRERKKRIGKSNV